MLALKTINGAEASVLNVSENTTAVPTVTFNSVPVSSTGTILYTTGDVANLYRSPFETVSGAPINPQFGTAVYTAVEGGASGTWNFAPSNVLTLFWGSPDAWNHVQFWSGLSGTGITPRTIRPLYPARLFWLRPAFAYWHFCAGAVISFLAGLEPRG